MQQHIYKSIEEAKKDIDDKVNWGAGALRF